MNYADLYYRAFGIEFRNPTTFGYIQISKDVETEEESNQRRINNLQFRIDCKVIRSKIGKKAYKKLYNEFLSSSESDIKKYYAQSS